MYKLLPILLFAYGLAITTEDIYDNSYALIIGIDKYENVPNLDYAVSDANSIASLLKDNFNFPSKNVKVLLNNEATYLNIRESLDEISSLAKENDRVLIFFAGHGLTNDLPDGGEMGYILPIDGKRDKLFATSIPMEDMKRISSMSQSKHMLFLIDACYGGLAATGARGLSSTTLNFIGNNASFASNVLNIPRMAWQDKVVLRYSNAASDNDLEQGSAGQLVWNSVDVAMASDLSGKQDSLTASAGVFLNGSTISSYTLRWNGSSTPTVPTAIQELHWDNYTVAQNVNLSTGKVELLVGHPTDMATQTWVTSNFSGGITQSQLNTH